jgi:hypothetical protein
MARERETRDECREWERPTRVGNWDPRSGRFVWVREREANSQKIRVSSLIRLY